MRLLRASDNNEDVSLVTVPTLDDVFKCVGNQVQVNVEVKTPETNEVAKAKYRPVMTRLIA